MKTVLKHAPKWLFLIPAVGLVSFGVTQTAQAEGNGKGGDANNNGTPKDPDSAHNPHDRGDVPEPGWYVMMAAGGIPMGLRLGKRWLSRK